MHGTHGIEATGERKPFAGWVYTIAGLLGVVTGVVPLTLNAVRILFREDLWGLLDLAAHGVEAMGLSVEWGLLSSALGLYLGVLLLWAGAGWRNGRPWAPAITWAYAIGGLTVNLVDQVIFIFRAKPGIVRTQMIAADAVALLIPLLTLAWLIWRRAKRGSQSAVAPSA